MKKISLLKQALHAKNYSELPLEYFTSDFESVKNDVVRRIRQDIFYDFLLSNMDRLIELFPNAKDVLEKMEVANESSSM